MHNFNERVLPPLANVPPLELASFLVTVFFSVINLGSWCSEDKMFDPIRDIERQILCCGLFAFLSNGHAVFWKCLDCCLLFLLCNRHRRLYQKTTVHSCSETLTFEFTVILSCVKPNRTYMKLYPE